MASSRLVTGLDGAPAFLHSIADELDHLPRKEHGIRVRRDTKKASYCDERGDITLANPQINPVRLGADKSHCDFLKRSTFFLAWNDSLEFGRSRETTIQ